MNLHVVPDNVFINKFYDNLQESGTLHNNLIVVRTNYKKLKYIKRNLPFGKLYSAHFKELVGDTRSYNKVYIHLLSPLLYRWVATHHFNELNWMVWGVDLYNLPSVKARLYEPMTLERYVSRDFSMNKFLYRAKVALLHDPYRKRAYGKVKNVLTWMPSEYQFAIKNLPGLTARHLFFFYENDLPYKALDKVMGLSHENTPNDRPIYILGNSSTPELNHLDAVALMEKEGVQADLWVPISYGDKSYASFLKKNLSFYNGGELRFIDQYMSFHAYLQFLNGADGLIMNNIRPQGYGNILIMMYLEKKIFLNDKNFSIPELDNGGLIWQPIKKIQVSGEHNYQENKKAVSKLWSHDNLLIIYGELFS